MLENRHDAIFLGDVARNGGDDVVGDLDFGEVYHFGAEMGGLRLGDVGLAGRSYWPASGPPRQRRRNGLLAGVRHLSGVT